ncbi:MAG: DNA mismatch repair protein MutS [Clostridium sp.]|nr:DNA mismatch repair protein MutS [Clostridium sp.]
MSKAESFYNDNIKNAKKNITTLTKSINIIGWIRLFIVLIGAFSTYKLYNYGGVIYGITTTLVFILIFLVVAIIHGNKISERDRQNCIIEINEKGLKRLDGRYREFEDKGKDLIEEKDPFCEDLDIFGQNSLFQMINTTRTEAGRKILGKILSLKELPKRNEIIEKQKAIKELGDKAEWRQKLYIDATFKKKSDENLDELIKWCKNKKNAGKISLIIAGIFMLITMTMIFLAIVKIIPFSALILDLMVNFCVIKFLTKDKEGVIDLFNSSKYSIKAYANTLSLIEDEEFNSEYLKKLKGKLKEDNKVSCKEEMKKLSSLMDWIGDSTSNAYYFIINVLAFADVFIIYNLNCWRERNGEKVEKWIEVMGEFDALSSIANISFDHDDWCLGEISNDKEVIAKEVAHPLIGERAVANDYELKSPKKITLITGSNMSGKSTFLRTIGINLVLTYIGAPACAKEFKCGIMNIYTCMRTKDNLEESISSFYAEILRIKLIIEACKKGENVFFLLDEIFKGTNSKDRHIGATVLVKQLAQNGAIGLLSTHDLELCDLEKENKEIGNFNFREYYEDNKIKFDYKLRKGKSETKNAVYLMKLAGIEISEPQKVKL